MMDLIVYLLIVLLVCSPGVIFLISKLGAPDNWQKKPTDPPPGMHVKRDRYDR